jgi:hypothetical protein
MVEGTAMLVGSVAGTRILGGLMVPLWGRLFARRTHVLLIGVLVLARRANAASDRP